jgi:hypothetical protein
MLANMRTWAQVSSDTPWWSPASRVPSSASAGAACSASVGRADRLHLDAPVASHQAASATYHAGLDRHLRKLRDARFGAVAADPGGQLWDGKHG